MPSASTPDLSATAPPLCLAFLGFNPLGDGFDGRGLIDRGADRTFTSLDTLGARRLIRRYFHRRTPTAAAPFDLRLCGYSFGGWSALQLAHALGPRFRIRIGLIDPVCTFRWGGVSRLVPLRWVRDLHACKPANAVFAVNVFQTKGLIARFDHGRGMRMPYPANWFASQPIEGFDNIDRSADVTHEGGHVEVAEKYAAQVATITFQKHATTATVQSPDFFFPTTGSGL
ncbi:hypothetical protein [Humisphaera borealis]|uniref:Uncharacterized protein n=1 Tax=Humisphaera borealis TaxID=2807512 RepID=A0A7M2WXD8_9BACT|nr:hypothetical protein [Humisphaera borealis]QOV89862.1 hypothetical protein IPV69_00360 [Humisphaera borealis]